LNNNVIYVTNLEGKTVYFDRQKLEAGIVEALETARVNEEFLAEDISYALEKYLEKMRDEGCDLVTVEVLNGHVVRLLFDAGYSDVAYAYSTINAATWDFKTSKELEAWDSSRALDLIKQNLLFQSYDLDSLAKAVNDAVGSFKFTKVSDSFVVELVLHIIANREPVKLEEKVVHPRGKKLFYASEVVAFSPKLLQSLFANEILKANDIGHIFPKFSIDFDFSAYIQQSSHSDGTPLMELLFLPDFSVLVAEVATLYMKINKFLTLTFPEIEILKQFNIKKLDTGISEGFKINARSKIKFRQEILALVKEEFALRCDAPVEIIYKNEN